LTFDGRTLVVGSNSVWVHGPTGNGLGSNVGVGFAAGDKLRCITSTGTYNSMFGNYAGCAITGGTNNTLLGNNAGISQVTPNDNTKIGSNAGCAGTTDGGVTAIGSGALALNQSQQNTAVGAQASGASTTACSTSTLGYYSGYNNSANNFTGVGHCSGYNNSGGENTAIGAFALLGTSATETTAVGSQALRQLSNGAGNTAVGRAALYSTSTGSGNTALGKGALLSNNGNRNTAVGTDAQLYLGSNSDNTVVGFNAGIFETGIGNVAIGSCALHKPSSSVSNGAIAIGYKAAHSAILASCSIIIGHENSAQGSSNYSSIIISSMPQGTYSDYNTIIGNNHPGLVTGATGQVSISDGCGNVRFYASKEGYTTIGATGLNTYNAKLHVPGNLTADGQGVSPLHTIGTTSGNVTFNWNNGNTQFVELTGNLTGSTFQNGITGGVYNILLKSNVTASASWTNVLFPGGTANGAITGVTGSVDMVSLMAGPTGVYYGAISKNYR
jgi:hypothetical protein